MKLLLAGSGGYRFQGNGYDRVGRAEIFQMSLEEPKKQRHRIGRVRNLEAMGVDGFVRGSEFVLWQISESKSQRHFLEDEIEDAETPGELLEKSLQDKQEGFSSFDFVLELYLFGKNFRWPNESEKANGTAAGLFPKTNGLRPEAGGEFVLGKSGELAQSMDTPAMKNGDDSSNFSRALLRFRHAGSLEEGG
jgi:hypothetical protein